MSIARRKLIMHSAHRSIGMSGGRAGLHSYLPTDDLELPGDGPTAVLRVALIADDGDADALDSLASFRRTVEWQADIECHRIARAWIDANDVDFGNLDGVVLFQKGLHLSPASTSPFLGNSVKLQRYIAGTREITRGASIRIEAAHDAASHPILDGVRPFEANVGRFLVGNMPDSAAVLLRGRANECEYPLAWVENRGSRSFHTTLGSPDDFGRPEFVRMVRQAISWVGNSWNF